VEKRLRQDCHKAVEWQFGVCLQQNAYSRVGLKIEIAKIAEIAKDWQLKIHAN
jgi:hypothetical protein